MRRSSTRRLAAFLVAVAASTSVAAAFGPGAHAAPIDDKKAQAAKLESDIETNATQLSALYEQIKAAQDQLDEANHTITVAQGRIVIAQQETDRLEGLVHQRAASVYRSAGSGQDAGFFDLDVSSLSSREQYASAASQRDDHLLGQLRAARADLHAVQRDAQDAKSAAETEKARLDAVKNQYEAGQAERQRLLAQTQGELALLVAQAAAVRQAAQTPKNIPVAGSGAGAGSGSGSGPAPAASGGAGAAVAYAQAQLGKPYCEAGTGPSCFDCSGLTMMAWAQGGVGMAHNSEAQYGSFPHVSMSALAPGDIVWRPGHVGLYVGGGSVIHAPHTGDVVRYIGVSYFQGAARP